MNSVYSPYECRLNPIHKKADFLDTSKLTFKL